MTHNRCFRTGYLSSTLYGWGKDTCNDTYGRIRMYQPLLLKHPEGISIPGERTVYRMMKQPGLVHRPKRKPNGITKADRQVMKSEDLLKRDLRSDAVIVSR